MQSRAKRLPKLRKIDVRVPVVRERSSGWDSAQIDLVDQAVLAKVDGQATVHAIATAAGVADEEIASSLEKLEGMRLVVLLEPSKREPSSAAKRLDSGIRPMMKTSPSMAEGGRIGEETVRVTETPAFEDDPEARLTLPGIGPDDAGERETG